MQYKPKRKSIPRTFYPEPAVPARIEGVSGLGSDAGAIAMVIAQLHKLPDIHSINQRWPKPVGVTMAVTYDGALVASCEGLIAWIFERKGDGEALLCDAEKSALLQQLSRKLVQIGVAGIDGKPVLQQLASTIKRVGTPEQQDALLRGIEDHVLASNTFV